MPHIFTAQDQIRMYLPQIHRLQTGFTHLRICGYVLAAHALILPHKISK